MKYLLKVRVRKQEAIGWCYGRLFEIESPVALTVEQIKEKWYEEFGSTWEYCGGFAVQETEE